MTAHDRRSMTNAQRAAELAQEMRDRGFLVTGVKVSGRVIEVLTSDPIEIKTKGPNPADLVEP